MGAALKSRARSLNPPPTEAEADLARESSRRLGPTLADLFVPNESDGTSRGVEISVHVPGKAGSETLTIPAYAFRLLATILTEMAQGNVITLTPIHAELTTKQAADLLNVSRPFVCKLLDSGAIRYRKVGRHRRVAYVDLMEYKKKTDDARSRDLDELAEQAQQYDMGY